MGKKVLLVDDDLTLNQMYEERLKMEGLDVATARDGQEAVAKAKSEKPDIVLLDIMMPGVDGFQVLEALRKLPETQKIPILLVTALIQETMRIKGKQLGATDFIIKSEITPGQLVGKIKEYMHEPAELKPET